MNYNDLESELNEWIREQRLSEYSRNTLVSYKYAANLFLNFIKDHNLLIDKAATIKYKDMLADKYSLATCNKYIIILNKFLKYLKRNDCLLKKFKTQRKTSLDDPLWPQEHKRMLRWAIKLGMEDMYLIMQIFALSGARVAELKYFTVENLNDNYIIAYNKGKERVLIMRNDLKRMHKKYCEKNKITEGYIFRSPVDLKNPKKIINASTIWRRLKKIAKAAKINPKKIHPHAWRHLFAKAAKEAGIDLDELRDILGHSDIRTTAIYTMTSNSEKRKKMEKIKF